MRRRLINSTLAVVLVVIAVFGVSLVIVESRTISNSAQESVDSEALRLISVVESRLLGAERINPALLAEQISSKRYALVKIPGRAPLEVGTRPTGRVISSTAEGSRASASPSRSPAPPSPGRSAAP